MDSFFINVHEWVDLDSVYEVTLRADVDAYSLVAPVIY